MTQEAYLLKKTCSEVNFSKISMFRPHSPLCTAEYIFESHDFLKQDKLWFSGYKYRETAGVDLVQRFIQLAALLISIIPVKLISR